MRRPLIAFAAWHVALCAAGQHVFAAPAGSASRRELRTEEMPAFLDWFEATLRDRWAYYRLNDADFPGAIAALRRKVDWDIAMDEFAIELRRILALGADGHSEVELGYSAPPGYLPFHLDWSGQRLVATRPQRSSFLDQACPFLESVDGLPVTDWLATAGQLVPRGSPQFVRHTSARRLSALQFLRKQRGAPPRDWADVELASADGHTRRAMSVLLAPTPVRARHWPQQGSRVLEGGIGYLRLVTMASSGVDEILKWMPRFRGTSGLVIDVRDNGGGQRDALRLVFSYLSTPADPPRVCACAAYRRHSLSEPGMMTMRHLYNEESEVWDAQEREAIRRFRATFHPTWLLPAGEFSPWHYMVLRHRDQPDIHPYTKPVMILMNGNCFSATDVFLAGLKGWRNVTLVGTASGGGSGAARTYFFKDTRAGVRISSMASFQPDGRLFDGAGVQPHVQIEPAPDYFIGGRDRVLERALELIRQSRPSPAQ